MNKKRLDKVYKEICQQKIDEENNKNELTSENKDQIYHDIIKLMVNNKTEYNLKHMGTQQIFSNNGIQDKISSWLENEHGIKCKKEYITEDGWIHIDRYYYIAFW